MFNMIIRLAIYVICSEEMRLSARKYIFFHSYTIPLKELFTHISKEVMIYGSEC